MSQIEYKFLFLFSKQVDKKAEWWIQMKSFAEMRDAAWWVMTQTAARCTVLIDAGELAEVRAGGVRRPDCHLPLIYTLKDCRQVV